MTSSRSIRETGWCRRLGRTGITASAICAGTSGLGSTVEPSTSGQVLRRVLDSSIRLIDTANEYSGGMSERLIGEALRATGREPDGLVVVTKVDRDESGGLSAERVRQSFEESLERLGLETVPLLYLHDPHKMTRRPGQSVFDAVTAPGGPLDGLLALKHEGRVAAIGLAGGITSVMEPLMRLGVFDAVLTHNRYTLVDRSADRLLDIARDQDAGVVNAAVFGGRILAQGTARTSRYAYLEAKPQVLTAVSGMEEACARYGVPLAAAALQFSLADPRIHSTVVGLTSPARVDETLALAAHPVPDDLWAEIESLVPAPEHWLDAV